MSFKEVRTEGCLNCVESASNTLILFCIDMA